MVVVERIEPGSLGARAGFRAGDRILRINGRDVGDQIDFQVQSGEQFLCFEIEREGEVYEVELERRPGEALGFAFEEMKVRRCDNRCIFCFIHQMPRGMRRSLYVEDDDYRLSFLHGSYVTLTNVGEEEIRRIIDQRLSPQYISVHATDPRLRQAMLGRRRPADILPLIERLASNGIEIHAQVVICPGWNDGEPLQRTVSDLSRFYPSVRSVALVPVGLTRFRKRLTPLRPVTPGLAREYVEQAGEWGDTFARRLGERFAYAADELFILAGKEIPPASYYETFPQIENGVGMARSFLDRWEAGKDRLPERLSRPLRLGMVTGRLASSLFRSVLPQLGRIPGLEVELIEIDNDFFGHRITVSGLLTGRDILEGLRRRRKEWDRILLPPNCVTEEGVTLDDMTVEQLSGEVRAQVEIGRYDLPAALEDLLR